MSFTTFTRLSPNFGAAPSHERLGLLLHHSVKAFDETIAYMLERSSQVSYHVLIASDGSRCTLVEDENIAWHAGASNFLGRSRCNDFLLGLAFSGNTYESPLTTAQITSALEWIDERWRRYRWTIEKIADHRLVTGGRKDDLNPSEWARIFTAITCQVAAGYDGPRD